MYLPSQVKYLYFFFVFVEHLALGLSLKKKKLEELGDLGIVEGSRKEKVSMDTQSVGDIVQYDNRHYSAQRRWHHIIAVALPDDRAYNNQEPPQINRRSFTSIHALFLNGILKLQPLRPGSRHRRVKEQVDTLSNLRFGQQRHLVKNMKKH